MKFRKKPVVIDAIQWSGDILDADVIAKFDEESNQAIGFRGNHLVIYTLEGQMAAGPGDWIIRGRERRAVSMQAGHLRGYLRAGLMADK